MGPLPDQTSTVPNTSPAVHSIEVPIAPTCKSKDPLKSVRMPPYLKYVHNRFDLPEQEDIMLVDPFIYIEIFIKH